MRRAYNKGDWKIAKHHASKIINTPKEQELARSVLIRACWNQKEYSEKVIYLPDSFMVNDFTKKISTKIFTSEELGLPKEGFVFCFLVVSKVFCCWTLQIILLQVRFVLTLK
jgi:hypothetical protein